MGVIVGIDKFMSECRALTNFTGNAVATLLIGKWTHEIDIDQARAALNGSSPFDELSLEPDAHGAPAVPALDEHTVALPLDELRQKEIRICVAGGTAKVPVLRAALQAGYVSHLVTDERTARAVLG